MTDNKEEELQKYFDNLYEQIKVINLLSEDLLYLFPTEDKYHQDIFHSKLLYRLIESLKVNFALRLSIFLDKDEDFNLVSFMRRILIERKKSNWYENISQHELHEIQKQINAIIESNEFQTIKYMRNKVYAHFDKKAEESNLHTSQDKVAEVISSLKSIMTTLGSKIFRTNYSMEFMHWDIDHTLLSILSNYHEVCDNFLNLSRDEKVKNVSINELNEWITKY